MHVVLVVVVVILVVAVLLVRLPREPRHSVGDDLLLEHHADLVVVFHRVLQRLRLLLFQVILFLGDGGGREEVEERLALLCLGDGLGVLGALLGLFAQHLDAKVLAREPLDLSALHTLQHGILLVDHVVGFGEHGIAEVRVRLREVKVQDEALLVALQPGARDVHQVLQRRVVALGDLLLERLVVAHGHEPEVGDAGGRLVACGSLLLQVARLGDRLHVLLALDDGCALDVQRLVQRAVPLIQLALLLKKRLEQLVVGFLQPP
mmetsp:Transcript_34349/g.55085  ORF Transcript_34349/g.55085 Transcript_34349/m.55085 type:complete len:263 (-) Transcript_34349:359-1147(-)